MTEYYIPAGPGEAEYDEKRSRFLGHVRCVDNEEDAKNFIAEMKKKYYDARHNCWCYIIKDGAVRYSDDSEPQGTAGIPMLEVFKREGIENVVCVVTRYFGGVLLGAGGLLRAYTKAAKDSLDAAGVSVVRRWIAVDVPCTYALMERLKNEIAAFDGLIEDTVYDANVVLKVLLPEEKKDEFFARIVDVTSGNSECVVTGEDFRAVQIR